MNIKHYTTENNKPFLDVCIFFMVFCFSLTPLTAQTDTTSNLLPKKTRIHILAASVIERNPQISDASRLIGDVQLAFDDAILRCDSAYRFDDGRFEVFNNVEISQAPATKLRSNYGILDPVSGTVNVSGDVTFNHEELKISCPSLTYNLDEKRVSYRVRANIYEGSRHLSSDCGIYNSITNRLYAGGNVEIEDEKDYITSDSLSIDRNGKTLRLYELSLLTIDGATIQCEKGEFDGKTGKGWFSGQAYLMDDQGVLAGDSLFVNRDENEGMAWGNVMISDSSRSMNVKGSFASRTKNADLVTGTSSQLVQIENVEGVDTLKMKSLKLERQEEMIYASGEVAFTQAAFSGLGDSLSWNTRLDEMWLLGKPVVWSEEDEMTGDTVKMILKENQPYKMQLLGNANVLSPANDSLDHAISGRDLFAYFSDGKLSSVDVIGNGTVEYYATDELDEINVNRATCSQIQMRFANGRVTKIILLGLPDGKFNPLENQEISKVRRVKPQM